MRIIDPDGNDITPTAASEPYATALASGQCYLNGCCNPRREGYWDCAEHAVPYPASCHVYQFDPLVPTPADQILTPPPRWKPRQGWQCPQCGRVYAPGLPGCTACNAAISRKEALADRDGPVVREEHPEHAPKPTGKSGEPSLDKQNA